MTDVRTKNKILYKYTLTFFTATLFSLGLREKNELAEKMTKTMQEKNEQDMNLTIQYKNWLTEKLTRTMQENYELEKKLREARRELLLMAIKYEPARVTYPGKP